MLADRIAWLGLVSNDVAGAARVFEEHFGLPRRDLESPAGKVPVFALGKAALALFEPEHPLCDGETKTGVHHIALAAPDMAASVAKAGAAGLSAAAETAGLGGGSVRRLGREARGEAGEEAEPVVARADQGPRRIRGLSPPADPNQHGVILYRVATTSKVHARVLAATRVQPTR